MKVFISYSSADKEFVDSLAWALKLIGVEVWYDKWEIKVGDSIVEKVFEAIQKSDALIVVLSKASVESKWVKEELSVAVIRRIEDSDILLLPLLKEDCSIPVALRHLRYADFRKTPENGLFEIIEAIEPMRTLWQSLRLLREHHTSIIEEIKRADLDDMVAGKIEKLHELMANALDIRCQIEFRQSKEKMQSRDFFQKISNLAEKGLDIKSQTWNALVHYRSMMAHDSGNSYGTARMLASAFRERFQAKDGRDNLNRAFDRLEAVMKNICEGSLPLGQGSSESIRNDGA